MTSTYHSVEEVDLYVGGLLEFPERNVAIGETFQCLFLDAFTRLKKGDRYFYDLDRHFNPFPFTKAELAHIRSVTMAGLICQNFDEIDQLTNAAFLQSRSYYT